MAIMTHEQIQLLQQQNRLSSHAAVTLQLSHGNIEQAYRALQTYTDPTLRLDIKSEFTRNEIGQTLDTPLNNDIGATNQFGLYGEGFGGNKIASNANQINQNAIQGNTQGDRSPDPSFGNPNGAIKRHDLGGANDLGGVFGANELKDLNKDTADKQQATVKAEQRRDAYGTSTTSSANNPHLPPRPGSLRQQQLDKEIELARDGRPSDPSRTPRPS